MNNALVCLDKILTEEEIKFCELVAKGVTCKEAFMECFPERAKICKHPVSAAFSLSKKPAIAQHIMDLAEARKRASIESMAWSRQQSIEALNYVINVCRNDIAKIQRGRKEELQFLYDKIQDPETQPRDVQEYIQKMLKLQQKPDINKVQIAGIIDAVAELNSMHGYNETNVNLSNAITFSGEDALED